jgi:hypothetical protein
MGDNLNEKDGFYYSEQVVDNLRKEEVVSPTFGLDVSFNSSFTPVSIRSLADLPLNNTPLNNRYDNPSSMKERELKVGFGMSLKKKKGFGRNENTKGDGLLLKRDLSSGEKRESREKGQGEEKSPEEEEETRRRHRENSEETKEEEDQQRVNIKLLKSFVSTSNHIYSRNDEGNDDAHSPSISPGFSEESWCPDNNRSNSFKNDRPGHFTDTNTPPACHSAVDPYVCSTSPFPCSPSTVMSFSGVGVTMSPSRLHMVKKLNRHNDNNNNSNKNKDEAGHYSSRSSSFCPSVSNPGSLSYSSHLADELAHIQASDEKFDMSVSSDIFIPSHLLHFPLSFKSSHHHKRVPSFPLYSQNSVFRSPASVPPTSTFGLGDVKDPSK